MDDIIALIIRILDPVVIYLGPHAVAAVAILGGVVTFFSSRKQRARERRLESKVDLLLEAEGVVWNGAEKFKSNATSGLNSLTSSMGGIYRALLVGVYTRLRGIYQLNLRSVESMSKTWIVGLLTYLAYFIKQATGTEIPDEMVNTVAEIILLVIPLIAMFGNMRKGEKPVAEHQGDTGLAE